MFARTLSLVCLLGTPFALGCTTSPESLCEHVLSASDGPPADKMAREVAVKKCGESWLLRKQKDPKAYDCYASCAMGTKHLVEMGACMPKCYPNEPKPKDEPDKLEGVIWTAPSAAPSASASASASSSASAPSPSPSASAPSPSPSAPGKASK